MSWFLRDKIAGAVLYAVAAIVATLFLAAIAMRYASDREGAKTLFRKHWGDLFAFALIGIPSAAFGGMMIAGLPMLLLSFVGISFRAELRWGAVIVAAFGMYVWSLVYWFRETFLRPVSPAPRDPVSFLGASPPNEDSRG